MGMHARSISVHKLSHGLFHHHDHHQRIFLFLSTKKKNVSFYFGIKIPVYLFLIQKKKKVRMYLLKIVDINICYLCFIGINLKYLHYKVYKMRVR